MTIDELVTLRDHADAVVKIVGNTGATPGRFQQPADLPPEATDKALDFFLSIYPNSPLKKLTT
jgi:hypothetical protein